MILPIVAYGHPTLRIKTVEIGPDYPELKELIENMYETMYNAMGVGLAAPQVDIPIRLFIVDGSPMESLAPEEADSLKSFKQVFINPRKIEEQGKKWGFEEGCLSIPDIREEVQRPDTITLKYVDEDFRERTQTFTGMRARIVQHEYDHLEGVLFTDHISPFRRRMLRPRLTKISRGDWDVSYPMKYPVKKR
ncbi:MAG: peptide deformylase [Bacteroidetes bacterium]|nr:MAG: peptide deformylase [Bacteroidota bacterium]